MGAELATGFHCRICGLHHDVLPLSFSAKAPHTVSAILAWQWEQRVVITRDQCVIDGKHFYLRGRIVVPIHDCREPYIWGVWAQVSAKSFYGTHRLWNVAGRERVPPFAGRLASHLPLFGNTLGLHLGVQTQVVGRRPHFTIHSAAHPLGAEQRRGITLARAQEIAALLLHSAGLSRPANRQSDEADGATAIPSGAETQENHLC